MVEAYWGLREPPFRGSSGPGSYHSSPGFEEALARLHYLVDNQRRLGIVLGGPGAGKSVLLHILALQFQHGGHQLASLNLLGIGGAEFYWTLATRLGTRPAAQEATFALWRRIADRLSENRYQQLNTVVLLDDAHLATAEVLSQVARLVNLDAPAASRLTVILAAEPQRSARLGQALLARSELRIELEPWSIEDLETYLHACLRRAGRSDPLFDPDAIRRIHQLARGVPRHANRLAELALIAAAGREMSRIDVATIESVHEELSTPASAIQPAMPQLT